MEYWYSRQDTAGKSLRRPNQINFPEAGGTSAGADVHRRRSQACQRRVRPRQGESTGYHLHRRAGRHRHQAVRL